MSEDVGFVYILENKAMPDIYKIGITRRDDLKERMKELFDTNIPLPFDCVYAAKVKNPKKVEDAIHNAFLKDRVHSAREFFKIEPDRVIPLLELYKIEDATISVNEELNKSISDEDKTANSSFVVRRPNFNFDKMGIKIGSKIILNNPDNPAEAIVGENNKVIYNSLEYSLSPLTKELLGISYQILPLRYWKYNGKLLQDYYNENYLADE